MSKSKGNAVDPFDALKTYGADAIRWYFFVNSAPWLPNRFYDNAVVEGQRKFMGTLWNTYAFFVLYANIDKFDPTKYSLEIDKLPIMDKWMLSKLNTLVKTVDSHLGNYRITESARALSEFVDEMSNWYVRRSRERFWAEGMEQDKINAYMTLHTTLVTVAKIAAPLIPFMTEEIYQNLVCTVDKEAPMSIHLCDYPTPKLELIDKELEKNMDYVLKLVVMGRVCRNNANIKNRQPIGQMYVKAEMSLPDFYQEIIAEELNVKKITFTDDVKMFTTYLFKPQLRTVGPKYGKILGSIKKFLEEVDGNSAMEELNSAGLLEFQVDNQDVKLTKEDLLVESSRKPGYVSEEEGGVTVIFDINLTDELLEEGFVRELVSKIQTMRKEAGFEVTDKIAVSYQGTKKANDIFDRNKELIADEVMAFKVTEDTPKGFTKEWLINDEKTTIGVEKK
jgi:isoleucyl-tRNA synthetase